MKTTIERSLKSAIEALQSLIDNSDEEEVKLGYIRNELIIALDYLADDEEICYCPASYGNVEPEHIKGDGK